jgi:HAD superfamily hydrolase (TIGR01509 family)
VLRALLWDVDGTVAETEAQGHRLAFNAAFESLGLPWHWGAPHYGELLHVAGGRERLLAFMASRPDAPATEREHDALARELHRLKNQRYAELVAAGGINARPGVQRLMDECRQAGVALAVVTTSSRSNVDALFVSLFGAQWRAGFAAVVCAEDAPIKKPDPQAYLLALERLGLHADEAFALEDSPSGLQAALAAGVRTGITRSAHFADADFTGAAFVCDDLDTPVQVTLDTLRSALAAAGPPLGSPWGTRTK